jgi:hypothetical protein
MDILTLNEIKALYPDQWVLVGNPTILNTKILNGVVLYSSKDKKEVCYLGKAHTDGFNRLTLTFTGTVSAMRHTGIMKRV